MKTLLSLAILFSVLLSNAQIFNITNYGAIGNGSTMNTNAIQAAIDACYNAGGGIVEIPAGNFLTSTIYLKSNVTIHIAQSATITGSGSTSAYQDVLPLIRSYTDNYTQRSVFYAEGQHNIAITGEGTFNGNGMAASFLQDRDNRPYGFRFISCTNVRFEGVTLLNSGFWMMHNFNVDTLMIKNITLVNHNWGNADGVAMDGCRNVIVDSCTVDCNDDALIMKTTSPIPCENISITNCTVATYSRAIKMGTETHGAYRNIHISNINVQFSTLGPFGTNYAAKCGINLSAVDGGSLENVLIENVTMTGIKVPILIRLGNRGRKYTDTAAAPGVGFVRNVELRNITASATTNVTSSITGIPGYYAQNIRLNTIDITFPGGQAAVYPGFVVPENISGGPEATIFGDTLPASGLYIRHVEGIQLNHVCIHPQQPDGRPNFVFDDVINSGNLLAVDSLQNCFSTDIDKLIGEERLNIFPNPFTESCSVHLAGYRMNSDLHLEIIDITGRKVYHQKMTASSVNLNLSHLESGIYFMQLQGEEVSITKRIVKE